MIDERSTKLPKLTKKQSGFVKDYVLSGNGEKAAMNNYDIKSKDPGNVARAIASENLTKPNVALAVEIKQETLKSALEKQGITPEKIARKVDELLDAKEPIYKNNNETGKIELVGEKKDYQSIDKGLKHALSIHGIDNEPQRQSGATYNFIFSADIQKEIAATNERIKRKLIDAQQN
jgi:hypothetical protein